ncbi:hypothetical protein AB5I39_06740 [Sphingomonas sp. MMS24-J45]|uniref:hypothetical protein n=1 Tax=Sphingomonas sp. MMS24-J45 TaxID=3238806 RepID=UPI00384D4493
MATDSDSAPAFMTRHGATAALLLLVTLAARAATLGNPVLGFDEQFYLLVGDRMLHGALPYVNIFDRKPIGLFLLYAGARLFGGEGFLQYKLLAGLFVAVTAFGIYWIARRHVGWLGSVLAAILYILWLNFMEGEGGQAPVFYNAFLAGAGALMVSAVSDGSRLTQKGLGALLLIGLALQVKYSVLLEGVYFGCVFLWLAWWQGRSLAQTLVFGVGMVALALLPTAFAALYYGAIGQGQAFVFANFQSVFGQTKGGFVRESIGLASFVGLFLPLILVALAGRKKALPTAVVLERRYLLGWLVTAIVSVVIYWRFDAPHYALPILLPACILLAPAVAARRRVAVGLAVVALVAGQIVLAISVSAKGGDREARTVAALAKPTRGCIFVYNGYPALYMLTHSCLPSRWVFPGHLNTADEDNPRALGGDPRAIASAILAANPPAIVDTYPVYKFGNPAVHGLLMHAIRERYDLAGCVATRGRVRLVYRLRGDRGPRALESCPAELRAKIG